METTINCGFSICCLKQHEKKKMCTKSFIIDDNDRSTVIASSGPKIAQNFLLRCKLSNEKTKQQLETYYVARAMLRDVFSSRDPCRPAFRQSMELISFIPMSKLTDDGFRIICNKLGKIDQTKSVNMSEILRMCQMKADLALKAGTCRGFICIFDLQNMSLAHITMISAWLNKWVFIYTKLSRIRVAKVYVVNMFPMAEILLNLIKKILAKDINRKIEVCKYPEAVAKSLPKHILPAEYGGTNKSLDELRELFYNYLVEYRHWFLDEENVKADLQLCSKNESSFDIHMPEFGVDGSFRKIAID